MTGSTKILTVSYGTFSCTLEGFDDPFATMRGIAEYFRDLAADDRYFGAEPPTPDVEMLQRIAEKEVQRRVEAQIGDGAVALRQVTSAAAPAAAFADIAETGAEADDESAAPGTPDQPAEADEVAAAKAGHEAEGAADGLDHGPLAYEDEYLLSDEPEDAWAVDPDAKAPAEGPAESVVEKLRRIRAVVSRSVEPSKTGTKEPFSSEQARFADTDAVARRDRANSETIRQITSDLDGDGEFKGEEPQDATPAASTGSAATAPTLQEPFEEDLEVQEPELPADTVADGAEEPAEQDHPVAATPEDADETGATDDEPSGGEPVSQEAPEDEIAADADESDSKSTIDAVLRDVSEPSGHEPGAGASEAEEAEEPVGDGEDTVESTISSLVAASRSEDGTDATQREARRTSQPLEPISDEGQGRLLAETDTKLNDDEGIRRRRVISQMRAAVAATKAERAISRDPLGVKDAASREETRYRNDLSEVVQKVSRSPQDEATARRVSAPPLVLVSSQRIDPVAPSPDSGVADQTPGAEESFADFAKRMGANELGELLEAAAAYTSFVEGQTSFSRPEIMRRVARVDPALKLTREDGLRSFGQLLRQGKFRKLERGQFTISEETRFKPGDRFVGE